MDAQFALSLGIEKLVQIVSLSIFGEINLENYAAKGLELIKDWLQTMQAFLQDHDEVGGGQILQDRCQQIQTFAYDIDDAIDEFRLHAPDNILGCKPIKPDSGAIRNICSTIKQIKERIENFSKIDR